MANLVQGRTQEIKSITKSITGMERTEPVWGIVLREATRQEHSVRNINVGGQSANQSQGKGIPISAFFPVGFPYLSASPHVRV